MTSNKFRAAGAVDKGCQVRGWQRVRRGGVCLNEADVADYHDRRLRSLLTGAADISGHNLDKQHQSLREHGFAWDADHLYFTVREPFPSRVTQTALVFGRVQPQVPLRIVSQMAGNGVIFSDGVEADILEFNSGMTATIDVAGKSGQIVL